MDTLDAANLAQGSVSATVRPGAYAIGSPNSASVVLTPEIDATMRKAAVVAVGEASGHQDVEISLGRALAGNETITVSLSVAGVTADDDFTLALQPLTQTGVTLLTSGAHSVQNPAVRFTAGASTATLRYSPVDNDVRSQPYVTITVTGGTATGGVAFGEAHGGAVRFVVTDDEAGNAVVPADWPLAPSGLSGGDSFRLLFVTSQARNAASATIGEYDLFASALVSVGHAAVVPYAGLFNVVASTAAADARDHTSTTFTSTDKGDPVYWLAATADTKKVADDYEDFYDGGWANENAPRDETGAAAALSTGGYFTGSVAAGTAASGQELGAAGSVNAGVRIGKLNDSGAGIGPLSAATQTAAKNSALSFYALSPVFTIAGPPPLPVPEISITAGTSPVTEGTAASFTVTADPAPTADLTVNLTVAETSTGGGDFVAAGDEGTAKTVTILANQATATFTVATVPDTVDEPDGAVSVTVATGSGYTVSGTDSSDSVAVSDDDSLSLTLSRDAGTSIDEGASLGYALTLSRALKAGQSVTATLAAGGTAAWWDDYRLACPDPVPAGVTCTMTQATRQVVLSSSFAGTSVTLTLTAEHDADADAAETADLGFSSSTFSGTYADGTPRSIDDAGSLTINEVVAPGVTLSAVSVSVTEASGPANTETYTVVLDSQPTHPVTVTATSGTPAAATVSTGGGAAGTSAMLTFTTSNWNSPKTVTVHGVDDSADQGTSRMVTITHVASSTDTNYAIAKAGTVDVTVVDDDDPAPSDVLVTLGVSATTVAEGASVMVTVTLASAAPAGGVVVPVQRRASDSTAALADYTLAASVTVASGSTSGMATLAAADDDIDEGASETLVIELGTLPSGYAEGTPSHQSVTITDNDDAGVTITQTNGSTSVTEASGPANADTYSVVLDSQPTHEVTVTVTAAAGVLVDGPDAGSAGTRVETLTFTTTNWNSAQDVTVFGDDDGVDQSATRTVTVTHGSASSDANYGSSRNIVDVDVTVTDNDTAGVTLSPDSVSVTEAAGGRTDSYSVVLDSQPTHSVMVTATSGTPAAATVSAGGAAGASAVLTFTTSNWASPQTVTVHGVDDSADQAASRMVTITHAASSTDANYTITAAGSVDVTVVDDDDPASSDVAVTLGASASAVAEGASVMVTVTLASAAPAGGVVVPVQRRSLGSTADAADYMLAASVTVASGSTSGTATLTAADDDIDEGTSETLIIELGTLPTGYSAGVPASVSLTIIDDDDPPVVVPGGEVPVVSVAGAPEVVEGEAAVFTLTASPVPSAPIVVTVSVSQQGRYLSGTQGQYEVTVGVSGTATLSIPTDNDNVDEGRGAIRTVLLDGAGYVVDADASRASVWVGDNDDPPTVAPISVVFDVVDSKLTEGDNAASGSVRLRLSRALEAGETLHVGLDRTNVDAGVWAFALAGSPASVSYDASAVRVTFSGPSAPREATVTVTAAAGSVDGAVEAARAVPFSVASVSGVEGAQGQIGDEHAKTLYIADSAAPEPVLNLWAHANQDSIDEGKSLTALFTLSQTRSSPTVVRFEVAGWGRWPTQPGDLGDPTRAKWVAADSQWEVVIDAGSLRTWVSLPVLDDQIPDGDKTFAVRIASVSAGVRIGTAEHVRVARDTSPDPEVVMRYRAVFDNDDITAAAHPDCAGDDTATAEVTYTVRLNKQPEPGRTVYVDVFDRADLTRKQITAITDALGRGAFDFNAPDDAVTVADNRRGSLRLWFGRDNWDTPQTVTVDIACAAASAASRPQIWHRTQAHPTPGDPFIYRQTLIEHPEQGWIRAAQQISPPVTHQPVRITATQ